MGSFLVIGMGRFGSSVAMELFNLGNEVLIIDEHEDNVSRFADRVTSAIVGDAKDEAVLNAVGIHNFDCVVVAMAGSIEDSIIITILLKEIGVKKVVCKAQNEHHAKALTLIGADKVVRPEYDMGKRVAHSLTHKSFIDFFELSPDLSIVEITTPKEWADKTIIESNLRRKYGITLLAIHRVNSKGLLVAPNADVVLKADDILVVFGSTKDINAINLK